MRAGGARRAAAQHGRPIDALRALIYPLGAMAIRIRETSLGGRLRPFLNVVEDIYQGDPHYVRPLDFELKERLSKKNPFFLHGEGTLFTAWRGGRCVGRCTAQIDREHLARYQDDTGFFGFLDTIEDAEVCSALLRAAERWLAARGIQRVRGPLSLNINEEAGCLVEGFDTPPMIMMPHHRPYQGGLIEAAGYAKVKDLYAWRYQVGEVSARARKAFAAIDALPEVRTRRVDPKQLDRDVRLLMDVFNDAWSDNWGFVPLTEPELAKMAADMKLILLPELAYLTDIDGQTAAVALALPNLNEAIADLHGALLPFGLPKLVWRLKVRGTTSARLIILGIRKRYRHVRQYAALSAYLYTLMNDAAARLGIRSAELSWTLEDNGPVNVGIKMMGGEVYKRYRIYEKSMKEGA